MQVRDNLSTYEKYKDLKDSYEQYLLDYDVELKELFEYQRKGEEPYAAPLSEVISGTYDSILEYQIGIMRLSYSMGENLEKVRDVYLRVVRSMEKSWTISSGYVDMVWMISIGIMLEVDESYLRKLADMVAKNKVDDFLLSFLINYKFPNTYPQTDKFLFSRPYKATLEIVSMSESDKEKGLERLKKYLTKEWYRGHSDIGWYNSHKSKWDIHKGYWSFESGALAKILNLNDSSLKDLQYYPYDMVHYKKQ